MTTSARLRPAGREAVEVISHEAWGGRAVVDDFTSHTIHTLTVHHTEVLTGSNKEAPSRMRSYQAYHQERGWPDVAYHYVIDAVGHVYEGRPESVRGDTGTEYDPTGHFLVCCDGHFDQQGIPDAQVASLVALLAWASHTFGVGPDTIAGHRDYSQTTCPGANLARLIADGSLREMVEGRLAVGAPSLLRLADLAGLERVAAIEAGP